jgi:hypothetical protein
MTSDISSPVAENNATDTNTSRADRLAAMLEDTEGSEIEDLEIEDLEIDAGKRMTFGTSSLQFTRVKKFSPTKCLRSTDEGSIRRAAVHEIRPPGAW